MQIRLTYWKIRFDEANDLYCPVEPLFRLIKLITSSFVIFPATDQRLPASTRERKRKKREAEREREKKESKRAGKI